MPAAKPSTKFTSVEFLAALGWTDKNVGPRLNALGLLEECTRCGGSGRYSYCQMYGDRCFKCRGSRQQLPKLTKKLLKVVQAAIEAGKLQPYLDGLARRAAAKKVLAPMLVEAKAAYDVVGGLYEAAFRAKYRCPEEQAVEMPETVCNAQTLNNAVYYGARTTQDPRGMSVTDLQAAVERGAVNPEVAVAEMTLRIEWLRAIAAAVTA